MQTARKSPCITHKTSPTRHCRGIGLQWLPAFSRSYALRCKPANQVDDGDKDKANAATEAKRRAAQLKSEYLRTQKPFRSTRSAEDVIGSLGAFTGLQGTVAVFAAYFCGVDPFGNFHWDIQDVESGLLLAVPIALCNLGIMLPEHNKDKRDNARSNISFVDLASAFPQTASSLSGKSQEALPRDTTLESLPSSSTTVHGAVDPSVVPSHVLRTDNSLPSMSAPEAALPGQVPASAWGRRETQTDDDQYVGPWWQHFREALAVVQMNLANTNFTKTLPVPIESGVVALEILSREMLYRAVLLTALSRWAATLLFQADAEEFLLPLGTSPSQIAPWGVLVMFLLLLSTNAGIRVTRSLHLIRIGIAAQRAQVAQVQKRLEASRKSPSTQLPAAPLTSTSSPPAQLDEPIVVPLVITKDGSISTMGGGNNSSSKSSSSRDTPWERALLSPSLMRTLNVFAVSTWINSGREILEVALASVAFVSTGNLAASFTTVLANQLLLSILQRHAAARQAAHAADISRSLILVKERLHTIAQRNEDWREDSSSSTTTTTSSTADVSASISSPPSTLQDSLPMASSVGSSSSSSSPDATVSSLGREATPSPAAALAVVEEASASTPYPVLTDAVLSMEAAAAATVLTEPRSALPAASRATSTVALLDALLGVEEGTGAQGGKAVLKPGHRAT